MWKRASYLKSFKETTFAYFSRIPLHQGRPHQMHTTIRTMLRNRTNRIHIKSHHLSMGVRRCLRMGHLFQPDMVSSPDTIQMVEMKS